MRLIFTLASFAVISTAANAVVRTVTCQNTPSHFLPVTVNAVVGDTIHWTWIEGGHIVGPISSSDIPGGAATWNAPIDAGNHTYDYVVTVAGNYHYVCHPATPHGEDAYIVVANATGVQQYSGLSNLFSVYPNPSAGKFTFNSGTLKGEMTVYNMQGEKIEQSVLTHPTSFVDLSNRAKGIYFVQVRDENGRYTQKVVVE